MPSLLLYALFPRVKQKELTSFTIKYIHVIQEQEAKAMDMVTIC